MMFSLFILFLAAALPVALYVCVAWWLDRHEREPLWLLALTFTWGAIPAAVQSLVAELIFGIPVKNLVAEANLMMVEATLLAPPIEEIFKAVPVLIVYLCWRHEFDGLMDGLLYGAMAGFGFAMTENFLYYLSALNSGGMEAVGVLFFLRSVAFGFNHALYPSMFGLSLAVSRFSRTRYQEIGAACLGLLAGMTLHTIHNYLAASAGSHEETALLYLFLAFVVYLGGCLLWFVVACIALMKESVWIREELAEEVTSGLLTPTQAAHAWQYLPRIHARWRALWEHGFGHFHRLGRLYALAAELGLKKHQARLSTTDAPPPQQVAKLRTELQNLQRSLASNSPL